MSSFSLRSSLLVFLALLAATLDILGTLDIPKVAVFGYSVDTGGTVTAVDAGRAAAAAGLQRGDRVESIDGLPFGPETQRRAGLVSLGDQRTLEVSRDSEINTITMKAGALSPGEQRMGVVTGLSGLVFIFGSLGLYLRSRSTPALAFAAVGITLGVAQGFRPVATSLLTHDLFGFAYGVVGALCLPLLVHFALVFPRQLKASSSRFWLGVLYAPAFAAIVLDAMSRLFLALAPTATRWMDLITLGGQSWLIYLVAWLAILVTSFLRTSPNERRERGLNVLLWGTLAAIMPILAAGLLLILVPNTDTSLLGFAFVPSLALPFVLGFAIWKSDSPMELQ